MAESVVDGAKRRAAEHAVSLVQDGMIVGIGSGSTVAFAIAALIDRVRAEGLSVQGVPTSLASAALAQAGGIPLVGLDDVPAVDLTIDGADEVDPHHDLIKGHGGALLREKLVAVASRRVVIIIDAAKRVARLGERMTLPVEVVPFGWQHTANRLTALGLTPERRGRAGEPFITDNANYILDCRLPPQGEIPALARAIKATVGVVEHGLFLAIADQVIVGTNEGIEVLNSEGRKAKD